MAILYSSWQADGRNGQTEISNYRSDNPHYPASLKVWLACQKADPNCVLITKGRTDHQSFIETTIYTKEGYIDPCTLPSI